MLKYTFIACLQIIVRCGSVTLLDSVIEQTDDYYQYLVDLASYLDGNQLSLYVELTIIECDVQPLLVYFPGLALNKQLVRAIWTQQVWESRYRFILQSSSPNFYFDHEAAFNGRSSQYLVIDQGVFPSAWQWRFNHFALETVDEKVMLGVLGLDARDNIRMKYHLRVVIDGLDGGQSDPICPKPSDCSGNGECSPEFHVCNCDGNHFNALCNNTLTLLQNDDSYNIYIEPFSWVYNQLNLDESAEGGSIQLQYDMVRGSVNFVYACLNTMLFNPSLVTTPPNRIEPVQGETILLHAFNVSDIEDCIANSSSLMEKLGFQRKPSLLLAFYNDQPTLSSMILTIELHSGGQSSLNLQYLYIAIGMVSAIIFVALIFLCKRLLSRQASQVQEEPMSRAQKRQATNQKVFNRYMPAKPYNEVIEEYPDLGEINECLVCLVAFESTESVRTTTCFHLFHAICLDEWLRRHQNCPVCRAPLNKKTLKEALEIFSQQDSHSVHREVVQAHFQNETGPVQKQIDEPTSCHNSHIGSQYINRIRTNSFRNLQRKSNSSTPVNVIRVRMNEQFTPTVEMNEVINVPQLEQAAPETEVNEEIQPAPKDSSRRSPGSQRSQRSRQSERQSGLVIHRSVRSTSQQGLDMQIVNFEQAGQLEQIEELISKENNPQSRYQSMQFNNPVLIQQQQGSVPVRRMTSVGDQKPPLPFFRRNSVVEENL